MCPSGNGRYILLCFMICISFHSFWKSSYIGGHFLETLKKNIFAWHILRLIGSLASFLFFGDFTLVVYFFGCLQEKRVAVSWNYVFSCFKFVGLFIEITPPVIKFDCETKFFGKNCSGVNFLLQGEKAIQ